MRYKINLINTTISVPNKTNIAPNAYLNVYYYPVGKVGYFVE